MDSVVVSIDMFESDDFSTHPTMNKMMHNINNFFIILPLLYSPIKEILNKMNLLTIFHGYRLKYEYLKLLFSDFHLTK
ncbi:MAG: hypothetical protein CMH49_10525 [Myxococcales bacterium]|nr:hypothetical protein [Myxococcales bacterium]